MKPDPRQLALFPADPWAHIYWAQHERAGAMPVVPAGHSWRPGRAPEPLGPKALASLADKTPRKVRA